MSHNQHPPPQQCREWSILTDELFHSFNSFSSCAASGSPCVFVIVNWCVTGLETGMPFKHLRTTQALVSQGLLNHFEVLRSTFPKNGTRFDAHSLKSMWKPPTSIHLRATWHTDSLDMVGLLSTGASHYHNCCKDGGTSPENFGYYLVHVSIILCLFEDKLIWAEICCR